MRNTLNILVAAGGTGGDLFPAVAILEQLANLAPFPLTVHFVGNPHRIEARVVPALGYEFTAIPVTGFRGIFSLETLYLPWRIWKSLRIAKKIIKEHHIDCVICGGSYISYPTGLAASQANIPLVLIEPNARPGKTNRLLASKASAIFAAFASLKDELPAFCKDTIYPTGNPIRGQFLSADVSQQEARRDFGLDTDVPTLLVFGGSLGALSINRAVESVLPALRQMNIQVLWQTGSRYSCTADVPPNVHIHQFIEDMASAYSAADVVVCRSGGGTVAELAVVGKPAILVPLPSAANNEQMYNARSLESAGGAVVVGDSDIGVKFLSTVQRLFAHSNERIAMADSMKKLGKPDAARSAATVVLELLKNT